MLPLNKIRGIMKWPLTFLMLLAYAGL